MNSGQDCIDMAETLIVLAGGNAWAAAREFGSLAAHRGDAVAAKHWRHVARAILRQQTARLGVPLEQLFLSLVPMTQPAARESVPADPAAAESVAEAQAAPGTTPEAEASPAETAVVVDGTAETIEVAAADAEMSSDPAPGSREHNPNAPIPLRARRQAMLDASDAAAGDAMVREAA